MKTLKEYKVFLKDYYDTTVANEDEEDTWEEFWEANLDALKDDDAIVIIDGVKYVKD